ncbi:metalloprotease [Streptomyces hainanensis]|uniref:M50 family peptidase n=1 Tax=Streptomyces hainanensis TaxID=402648 RepID=A0A4R4THB4_9ACTN|nr:M50 family metallopeptidase [Streptomyces hainanensis]TDC73729.1 M50 family peptidase [Streptomyces hainanensis]
MTARGSSLAGLRPRLRPGVLISDPLLLGPRTVHLVKEPAGGRSFEVGPRERFLMARMDGSHTLEELGTAYAETFGKRLGDANWRQLLALLGGRGLLDGAPAPPKDAAERPANGVLRGSVRLVADAHATAGRLHRAVGFLLAPGWQAAQLALLAGMVAVFLARLPELVDGAATVFTHPVLLLAVATALWFSTALHELAHAVAARHHGGRVGEIGLRWRLPVVIMYCVVDDYPYLGTRRQRIVVAAAGAVTNLLFLTPFCVWWLLAPAGATREALAGLLFLGTLQALAMLVPLPPLDGYTIVGQALRATRLATSSREFLALAARRDPAAAAYPREARRAYLGYGLCAVLAGCLLLAALVLLVHALLVA